MSNRVAPQDTRLPAKAAVRAALETRLVQLLASMSQAAKAAAEGATHAEARAEGDKDMRSTETSYLARGQSMRADELADELRRVRGTPWPSFSPSDALGPGALLCLEDEDAARRVLLLLAYAGGQKLLVDGIEVSVVTPDSPVGHALIGRRCGDAIEVPWQGKSREVEIVEVH